MKKKAYLVLGFLVCILVLISYLTLSGKATSYSSPAEALKKFEDSSLPIVKVVGTEHFLGDNIAYVVFYSEVNEPKDYLGIAKVHKDSKGWRVLETKGALGLSSTNVDGSYSGENKNYMIGLAPFETQAVWFGNAEARVLALEEKQLKVWLIHEPEEVNIKESKLSFLDEEENNLLNN